MLKLSALTQMETDRVSFDWTEEQKSSKKRFTVDDIIAYDETGFYALKQERSGLMSRSTLMVEKFDNDMNFVNSQEIEFEYEGKSKSFEFFIHMDDIIYVGTSFYNAKKKTNYLFIQSLNLETLTLNDDIEQIAEITSENSSKRNTGYFSHLTSRDKSKFMVYYSLPKEKKSARKYGAHVYTRDLEEVWSSEYSMPELNDGFMSLAHKLDNKGDFYILGSTTNSEDEAVYRLLCYTDEGKKVEEVDLSADEYYLTDIKLTIDDDLNIICGGFYKDFEASGITGSFYMKIDGKSKELETFNTEPFTRDFIVQNFSAKQLKKTAKKEKRGKAPILFRYYLDDIILKKNGGAVLIGEQYYVRVTTSTDANGNTTTTYTYYYNTIIVISIDAEGEIEWTEKIEKRQVSKNDGGFWSSYALAVVGSNLHFVFNDHPENLFYKGDGPPKNFTRGKHAIVSMVTMNSDGEQVREKLFAKEDAEVLTRPKVCEQVSADQMVLFGQKGKKYKFAMMTFEEE